MAKIQRTELAWDTSNLTMNQTIPRKLMATYINIGDEGDEYAWYLVGTRVEDAAIEMNGEIEESTDILGNVWSEFGGVKPSIAMSPFPIPAHSPLHKILFMHYINKDWAKFSNFSCMNVFGFMKKNTGNTQSGFIAETYDHCTIEITSLGGDERLNMDFTIHFGGQVAWGTVSEISANPTFRESGTINVVPVSGLGEALANLTVTSVAGTASGKTAVSFTGYTPSADESLVYSIDDEAVPVSYMEELSQRDGWTEWDGTSEITASSGDVITVAVVDAETDEAAAVGHATIVSND